MNDWSNHEALLQHVEDDARQIAFWTARLQRDLAAVGDDPLPFPSMREAQAKQWVAEEVGPILKVSGGTARMMLSIAEDAVEHFDDTLKLLEAGEISPRHLDALVDACRRLSPELKRAVQARVIDRMPTQSLTNFRKSLQRAVLAVDPKDADELHDYVAAQRRVTVRHGAAGMSFLYANLPTPDAEAIRLALDTRAREQARAEGESRTLDQLRADTLIELVAGGADDGTAGTRPGASVNVCVALSTLVGLDDEPGELADGHPISATQARLIAFEPTSTWRRLITDERGVLVDYGRSTHRPPAALARFVRARDRVCVFPHCNRPAGACDLDHTIAWSDGGQTDATNLAALCQRNHTAKHEAGWQLKQLPDGGQHWTSPTGRTHQRPPATYPIDTTGQDRATPAPAAQPAEEPPPF